MLDDAIGKHYSFVLFGYLRIVESKNFANMLFVLVPGKNDGSVAGVRYFQCSEKKGVFSRLTRLTRSPLMTRMPHDVSPVSDAGSVFERPPSGMGRQRRALSPNGSIRSMVSSKMSAYLNFCYWYFC